MSIEKIMEEAGALQDAIRGFIDDFDMPANEQLHLTLERFAYDILGNQEVVRLHGPAGYPNALAAAQNASEAAAELLRCAREEDAVPIEDMLEKLLDAARLVGEIEMREEDCQVLGAIRRWLEGDRT